MDGENELDLDISNYELDDILRLFKIPTNFEEEDMKKAKQIVLKTHPDKSRLPAKFFIFYSQAYKVLFQLYEFKNKSSNKKQPENYEDVVPNSDATSADDKQRENALAIFFNTNEKLKESRNFNKWFNAEFEKNKMDSEDSVGYGDWLSSNEDIEPEKKISLSQMGEEFGKKKAELRALVPKRDIEEVNYRQSVQGTSLTTSGPMEFNSDLFSSLPYQDLRQAHVESVIPVTEEDYYRVKKFQNINELTSYRNSQDTKPLSEKQAMEYLNKKNNLDNEQATKRAYDLAKQTELAEKKNQQFWGGIMQIRGAKDSL